MKKFKLLASIASMCLAIAVLCFGVFAASSVTYTISGTISYEVSDFFMDITTRVYYLETENVSDSDMGTKATALQTATITDDAIVGYNYAGVKGTYAYDNGKHTVDGTVIVKRGDDATGLTLTSNALNVEFGKEYGSETKTKAYTYFVVITFKNYASRNLKVNYTVQNITIAAKEGSTVTTNVGTVLKGVTADGIAQNGEGRVVVGLTLKDKTKGIPSADENKWSLPITFVY